MTNKKVRIGSMIVPFMLLAGCNLEQGASDSAKPAALVNGRVVPSELVKLEVAKLGQVPAGKAQPLANQVLKAEIDQELLAQEAVKAGLGDRADVKLKLDAARRQILAQSELEELTKGASKPTAAEIEAYFDANPELFARRKIFKLIDLVIETTPDNAGKVHELMSKAADINKLVAMLKQEGVVIKGGQIQKPAEDLPNEMLSKLATMKNNQSITFEHGGKINILVLVDTQHAPVTLDKASPTIANYLINQDKSKMAETALSKIRSRANIEYRVPYSRVEAVKN